jgi:hypothetical protein
VPVVELTSAFVRQASCPSGQRKADYFDSKQRGFLIEIRCSGRKTYYQRYCDERGRERQFKIGRGDVLTAEQARRAARSILARAVLGEKSAIALPGAAVDSELGRVRGREISAVCQNL